MEICNFNRIQYLSGLTESENVKILTTKMINGQDKSIVHMTKRTFIAVIESSQRGGSLVKVPFDIKKIYGKGRIKVLAHFDGIEYRGSVVSMGGNYILGIRKDIRNKLGKNIGDSVEVTFEEDTEHRTVEIPKILSQELDKEPELSSVFEKLSYTHQKEYISWINDAKKEDTKKRRLTKTLGNLREKLK